MRNNWREWSFLTVVLFLCAYIAGDDGHVGREWMWVGLAVVAGIKSIQLFFMEE